jgi:hypothetical protein
MSGLYVDVAAEKLGGPGCGFSGKEVVGWDEKEGEIDGFPKTDVAACGGVVKADSELLFEEKAFVGAFSPEPNTEPVLAALVNALPPGPKTDPDGLVAIGFVDALPPGPKTDPAFAVENADPPNADPVAGCEVPNPEGCAKAEVVVPCAGVPKADVAAGVFPKEDCPNTDPPDDAGVLLAPDPKADGWAAKAEKPPPDGELPLPKAEAPDPANALKAPPLADEPKAPEAGLMIDGSGCDVCPNAEVCCGWPNTDVVAGVV